MRRRTNRPKTPTELGLTVYTMRRKLWMIRIITGTDAGALVRIKLVNRVRDGMLPRAKDFWKLCEVLGLEPEDFVLSERFLVEKLRGYRRQHVVAAGGTQKPGQED